MPSACKQELVDHARHVGRHAGEAPLAAAQVVVGAAEFGGAGAHARFQGSSWAASSVAWAFLRSVMSRTRASTSFWPSLRKAATRASVGNVVPSRRRLRLPSSGDGHAGHHVFPAFGGFLGFGIGVDVAQGHRQQVRAGVAQALASFLVHVDEPAGQVVDEDRLARLLDEVAEAPLALAQGGFGLLALGGVAREGRHARRLARGRIADAETGSS